MKRFSSVDSECLFLRVDRDEITLIQIRETNRQATTAASSRNA